MKNNQTSALGGPNQVSFAWHLTYLLIWPVAKWVWHLKVEGRDHLPREGSYILCSNHETMKDPPAIGFAMYPLPVHYWAKIELFSNRLFAWVLKELYAIPIDRSKTDRRAIDEALAILADGGIVGVFPQGTRRKNLASDGGIKKGACFLAKRAGVPVVPASINWTGRHALVRFGPPLQPEHGESTAKMTEKLESAIKALEDG